MTWPDYIDHLMEFGMGWMGWTERETLDTTIPALKLAISGRFKFIRASHGMPIDGGDAPVETTAPPADSVFAAFRTAAKQ